MKNTKPQNAREILDALVTFITPSDSEVLAMSDDEIKNELEAKGINVDETVGKLMEVVKRNQAKSVLLLAKGERERKLARVRDALSSVIAKTDITKEELLSELKTRFKFNNEKSLVFCRKFEEAPNEDIRTLIEDLELLNLLVEGENE